jgi:2'-5' RNA ligase
VSRLFVAIDVPDIVRAKLASLKTSIDGARWVPAEQIHLTLRFIGDAEAELERSIRGALRGVAAASFEIAVKGVGQFPKDRPARVLWVGVEPEAPLVALASAVEEALHATGLTPEDRPFSPHITLARLKDRRLPPVKRFLEENAAIASDPFRVGAIELYASVLSSQGATHSVVETFLLT